MSRAFKRVNGFFSFAFLPTKLTSGETVWFRRYYIAGKKFGCQNRYAVNHRRYEILYSEGPASE